MVSYTATHIHSHTHFNLHQKRKEWLQKAKNHYESCRSDKQTPSVLLHLRESFFLKTFLGNIFYIQNIRFCPADDIHFKKRFCNNQPPQTKRTDTGVMYTSMQNDQEGNVHKNRPSIPAEREADAAPAPPRPSFKPSRDFLDITTHDAPSPPCLRDIDPSHPRKTQVRGMMGEAVLYTTILKTTPTQLPPWLPHLQVFLINTVFASEV